MMDRFQYQLIEKYTHQPGKNFHSAFKPFTEAQLKELIALDTLSGSKMPESKLFAGRFGRKLFTHHFIHIDSAKYQLYIDPLFEFSIGRDQFANRSTYVNSRGFQVMGNLGKDFSFYSAFMENQSRPVFWVGDFVNRTEVMPGQGRAKPFKTDGFDYAWAIGHIAYKPSRFFDIQLGNDRVFIGDGYRSLFLSDNAFFSPYLKITSSFWKIQYTNLFTTYQNIGGGGNAPIGGYPRKFTTMHHLSWNITKRWNLGLFETVIWQGKDSTGQGRNFDLNYINPVIFYRPVEFSLGSPDNVIIGFSSKYILFKHNILYGQLVIADFHINETRNRTGFWANKQGFQLGTKWFDLFGVKNLNIMAEYNYIRPYTYTHFTTTQSYTHFAQALAHPVGANLTEAIGMLNYRYRRIGVELKANLLQYGADTIRIVNGQPVNQNFGQNIFLPVTESTLPNVFGNKVHQGLKTNVLYAEFLLTYLVNVKTNMRFELGITQRVFDNAKIGVENASWIRFGFRTNLPNRYYDF
ncbi:MAG: hypothetical protein ACK4GL_09905 [Flavobacteriales bacterium]